MNVEETCLNVRENLPWLVTGRLTASETVATMRHLHVCPNCMKELVFFTTEERAAKAELHSEPTTVFMDTVWQGVRQELGKNEQAYHPEVQSPLVPIGNTHTSSRKSPRQIVDLLVPGVVSSVQDLQRTFAGIGTNLVYYLALAFDTEMQ